MADRLRRALLLTALACPAQAGPLLVTAGTRRLEPAQTAAAIAQAPAAAQPEGRPLSDQLETAFQRGIPSLEALFEGRTMGVVFNGDAGDAAWQRDIAGQPWLADGATIIGYDLPQPTRYAADPDHRPGPTDWRDVTLLTKRSDPAFPKPKTVDLVHGAFMEMEPLASDLGRASDWRRRLNDYMSLVKNGGYLLLAHNADYKFWFPPGTDVQKVIEETVLGSSGWRRVAVWSGQAPADYPVTTWWRKFEVDHPGKSFLLAFQKQP